MLRSQAHRDVRKCQDPALVDFLSDVSKASSDDSRGTLTAVMMDFDHYLHDYFRHNCENNGRSP